MRFLGACVFMLLFVGCSVNDGADVSTEVRQEPRVAVTVEPSPATVAPTPSPGPTEVPTPGSAATTPDLAEAKTITLWFPARPASFDDPTLVIPFDVASTAAPAATDDERIRNLLDLWIAGPANRPEFLDPLPFRDRDGCVSDADFDRSVDTVVVTVCGLAGLRDAEATRAATSLAETFAAAGFGNAVLLTSFGDECIGTRTEDEPLACLPAELQIPEGDGFRCPAGRRWQVATVTGVDDWVNSRSAPSTSAVITGRVDRDTAVQVLPSTLIYDGTSNWWTMVQQPDRGHCAWVAADFLTDDAGRLLADVAPGVTFQLPATGHWSFARNEGEAWGGRWSLDEGFATSVSIRVEAGSQIDDYLAEQLESFERAEYDYPDDWYDELQVPGADRAVAPIVIISESGDGALDEVLVEVDDYTIRARTYVYIEDLGQVPQDEMRRFLRSLALDRETLLLALAE